MIKRTLETKLRELARYYPAVAVTGPRQSGKTTLCQMVFQDKPYVSLEAMDIREYAINDPRDFLARYADGAVLDEIQQAPELLTYLQTEIDTRPDPGRFILTGSQHFGLSQSITQSLAGRCGILVLLPPSLIELRAFPTAPSDLTPTLWQGAYPRIYDRGVPARQWLADYTATYVQRDVRQVVNVGDLQAFSGFLKLCAGRTAQEINLSKLGSDAGVSHNTARSWLSILETSYIIHRLPAWHTNIRKQIVKAPKLHFFDTGLVCYLLGIREPEQLHLHPLRGPIFESWVVSEIYKGCVHGAHQHGLYHYREARGPEIDLIIEKGAELAGVEIKAGATVNNDFFRNLRLFADRLKNSTGEPAVKCHVVYGGQESQQRSNVDVRAWQDVHGLLAV
jgi:uncharacterized protein